VKGEGEARGGRWEVSSEIDEEGGKVGLKSNQEEQQRMNVLNYLLYILEDHTQGILLQDVGYSDLQLGRVRQGDNE
jgi:hypothetical protein